MKHVPVQRVQVVLLGQCSITLSHWKLRLLTVRVGYDQVFEWDLTVIHTFSRTAVTQHNLVFQARVMGGARDAIINGIFPQYLKNFFANYFGDTGYPEWCVNALRSVGVDLLEDIPEAKVVSGTGAKWERVE